MEREASVTGGSTIVDLAGGAPFGCFAASGPDGLLRFVPIPTPAGPEVVAIVDPSSPVAPGGEHRFLALAVRSVTDLGALGEHPVDFVVLDPRVIAGDDGHATGSLAAIVAYCRARSIAVVATGIPDQGCYERLRSLGVRYGSGPLIDQRLGGAARPEPAHSLQERMVALGAHLDALDTAIDVASAVCEHVSALGLLPSVYVERNGLLRCIAQRGYWQVMDGIPIGMGVLGRTFRQGRAEHIDASVDEAFIAAAPGLVAEVALPLAIDGVVRAVFSVESTRSIRPAEVHEVERIGTELARALQRVGIDGAVTALHSLARANAELASSTDEETVAHTAVRMACTVSGTSSAMIALPTADGRTTVRAAAGPLAPELRRLDGKRMTDLTAELGGISSCMAGGDEDGHVQPVFDDIRRSGGTSLVVFPVRCEGHEAGLLFVADEMPGGLDVEAREDVVQRAGDGTGQALRLRAERDSALDAGHDPVAIVLADIDWFKQVNDRLGHLTGDRVLVDTAQAMLECLRQHDQLFRIGGDEFAIVVPGVDTETAAGLSRRLVSHTRSLLGEVGAGLSVGVAVRAAGETMQQCMVRADRSLYEAKAERPTTAR